MKKVTVFVLSLVAIVATLAIPAAASTATFSDVPARHWAHQYIQYATAKGLVHGFPDRTFHPDDKMTEAQCCQIIFNILGNSEVATANTNKNQFISWYTDAVAFVERNTQLRISPDREASRAFLCNLIASFSTKESNNEVVGFPDCQSLTAATRLAINYCQSTGIVNGYPDGNFHPNDSVTRAEGATILAKWHQGGKVIVMFEF